MPDYDWRKFEQQPPRTRFPEWAKGWHLWREFGDGDRAALERLLDALILYRVRAGWGTETLECPRLFITHQRNDEADARRIAKLAKALGYQIWLDVLDPVLVWLGRGQTGLPRDQEVLLTASIIETALLNSTHIIAVITPNTAASRWVPYEFGRAKDSSLHSLQAGSWIHSTVATQDLADYFFLGDRTTTDLEVKTWLKHGLARWDEQFGTHCQSPAAPEPEPTAAARETDLDDEIHRVRTLRPVVPAKPLKFRGAR